MVSLTVTVIPQIVTQIEKRAKLTVKKRLKCKVLSRLYPNKTKIKKGANTLQAKLDKVIGSSVLNAFFIN